MTGGLAWRKASASTANGACVELALWRGNVLVRDSKNPDGPVLRFPQTVFAALLDGIKHGEFDNLVGGAQ